MCDPLRVSIDFVTHIYTNAHTSANIHTNTRMNIHCDGPAGEQCRTWPNGGHKGSQRQPRGVVLDWRYYPKSCVIETPPYSGVSAYHTEVC